MEAHLWQPKRASRAKVELRNIKDPILEGKLGHRHDIPTVTEEICEEATNCIHTSRVSVRAAGHLSIFHSTECTVYYFTPWTTCILFLHKAMWNINLWSCTSLKKKQQTYTELTVWWGKRELCDQRSFEKGWIQVWCLLGVQSLGNVPGSSEGCTFQVYTLTPGWDETKVHVVFLPPAFLKHRHAGQKINSWALARSQNNWGACSTEYISSACQLKIIRQ